jgi:predicted metal-dependent HD superfamily phosphohydrolase
MIFSLSLSRASRSVTFRGSKPIVAAYSHDIVYERRNKGEESDAAVAAAAFLLNSCASYIFK